MSSIKFRRCHHAIDARTSLDKYAFDFGLAFILLLEIPGISPCSNYKGTTKIWFGYVEYLLFRRLELSSIRY